MATADFDVQCSIEDAKRDCRHDWMREALEEWTKQLSASSAATTATTLITASAAVTTTVTEEPAAGSE